jgi:UDP-N-acetylmuramyl pentapeptide synthase
MMKTLIAKLLQQQAKRWLRKNKPSVVIVSGSVGKTSTTQAIATVLSESFEVRKTIANYNSDLGVPCSVFGRKLPRHLFNPFSWAWMLFRNELSLLTPTNVDKIVLELGADTPGELSQFAWLQADIAVITAVAPEHMEMFKTIDAVAKEELSIASYSQKTFINAAMVDDKFLKLADTEELYKYETAELERHGISTQDLKVIGEHSYQAVAAAVKVGQEFMMEDDVLQKAVIKIEPQAGRMKTFKGIKNSTIIDDTYNASPEAMFAALHYLYSLESSQKIFLLGNMNELGATSETEHNKIGELCTPTELDLVVTLGPDANKYSAKAATANGCTVIETNSPYEAADVIKQHLIEGATVLIKGSQNGVFAEEAVKLLLMDKKNEKELVRQDRFWMRTKSKNLQKMMHASSS